MVEHFVKVNVQIHGAGRLHETVCTVEHIETRLSERVWQYVTERSGDREWGERRDDPSWLRGPLLAQDAGWTSIYEHDGAYTFVYDEQHRRVVDRDYALLQERAWFRNRSVPIAPEDVVPLIECVLYYDATAMAIALRGPMPYRGAEQNYWSILDKYVTASRTKMWGAER